MRKKTITLHIQELPEGVYLATSEDIPGLVVQEKTIDQTLTSSCEVAQQILEVQAEQDQNNHAAQQTLIVS